MDVAEPFPVNPSEFHIQSVAPSERPDEGLDLVPQERTAPVQEANFTAHHAPIEHLLPRICHFLFPHWPVCSYIQRLWRHLLVLAAASQHMEPDADKIISELLRCVLGRVFY